MIFRHWERNWIAAAQPEARAETSAGSSRGSTHSPPPTPVNHLFHTFWFLILRDGGAVAGSACFKGAADADGRVEIGYGLEKAFEKQGYMTEAVRALCAWAKQQPGVRQITAETDPDNRASQRVLQRAGFHPAEADATRWWSL
nr:GNAT family N-acetyltransferase [Alistipes onderdonkii]